MPVKGTLLRMVYQMCSGGPMMVKPCTRHNSMHIRRHVHSMLHVACTM